MHSESSIFILPICSHFFTRTSYLFVDFYISFIFVLTALGNIFNDEGDQDDEEEGCWETDSDDEDDEDDEVEVEVEKEEISKVIEKSSNKSFVANNNRNPEKVKVPIPTPKIGGQDKSTIARTKVNPINDIKISSVKNLSKVVEVEEYAEKKKNNEEEKKGEKTPSSSAAFSVGDRVLVNSR